MPFAVSGKDRGGKSGIFRRPKDLDKKDDKVVDADFKEKKK